MLDLDRQTHSVEIHKAASRVHHESLVRHHHMQNSNANAIDYNFAIQQLSIIYRYS